MSSASRTTNLFTFILGCPINPLLNPLLGGVIKKVLSWSDFALCKNDCWGSSALLRIRVGLQGLEGDGYALGTAESGHAGSQAGYGAVVAAACSPVTPAGGESNMLTYNGSQKVIQGGVAHHAAFGCL